MTAISVAHFDLKAQYSELREEILNALDAACRNSNFILGEEVAAFEREFASFCETKHCVAVNSGTSALHLALLCAGVGPGDEVITTPNTFIATTEAISYTGAKPVFVDIEPSTANIDPLLIEAAITPRTKAIVPVHLYGRPVNFDAIAVVAARHRLSVIEDACQAHGARYHGRRVGSLGVSAAFSFYPSKNLGAYGEGGALTTNDDTVAERARRLRDHGQARRYVHEVVGFNYRMDAFQGAVLRIKLKRLTEWTRKRQAIALRYREMLAGSRVEIPADDPCCEAVYHLFTVYLDRRDEAAARLADRGVQTGIYYARPIHLQQAYAGLGHRPGDFPHTERACERTLSLPLYPELDVNDADYAARSLAEFTG